MQNVHVALKVTPCSNVQCLCHECVNKGKEDVTVQIQNLCFRVSQRTTPACPAPV